MDVVSRYSNLVKQYGEDYAKAEMKRLRSLVKDHPGGSFKNPEKAKLAQLKSAEARRRNNAERKAKGEPTV